MPGCGAGPLAWAVGHAEPDEIDAYGIIAALRLAGRRALAQLPGVPSCVLLDGNHDWLTPAAGACSTTSSTSARLEPAVPSARRRRPSSCRSNRTCGR